MTFEPFRRIKKTAGQADGFRRVIDGARTHDSQNHNLELYQLSYDHHVKSGRK
jgi:hypothetical protein